MIHDNKYAHRDIQPKNILLFNNGSIVKISDFGSITNKYYNDINSNPALRAEVIFDITKNNYSSLEHLKRLMFIREILLMRKVIYGL